MKYDELTIGQKLIGNFAGLAIVSPLAAWNYWGGIVALFENHPTYLQVWAAAAVFMVPRALNTNIKAAGTSMWSRFLQLATLIAFFSWVLRFVGIMPNAPF